MHWYGEGTVATTIMQFLHFDQYIGAAAGLVWLANVEGFRSIVREVLILDLPAGHVSG